MRVVVVGYGMAGARVATELRARREDLDVVVLGAEPHRAYNRILLSSVVAGKVTERDVALAEPTGRGVDVRTDVEVLSVDRLARTLSTSDGVFHYDRLVLATGGRPLLPEIKGLVLDDGSLPERVVAFRTLDDCRRILDLAERAGGTERAGGSGGTEQAAGSRGSGRALVLGGGLLGLEAARGLAARGLDVTVVHALGHLMERQLDPAASAVLVRTLAELGIRARLDATTVAVRADADGVQVVLAGGEQLDADLLIVSCGVRAETGLAEAAGLRVERGILVNDRMLTSDPAIFAIGDCAQHNGVPGGLVAPAWAQAQVAADVISGARPLSRYVPAPLVTRLKATGIDLAAMGESATPVAGKPDPDQLTFTDPRRGTYAKLVIRDDRLAGAILLGDNPTVGTLIQLFDRGGRLPADLRSLLLGRVPAGPGTVSAEASPALMPDAAVECRCNTVCKGTIVAGWRAGDRDMGDVAARTRATTGCGSCTDTVAGILGWLSSTEEVSA